MIKTALVAMTVMGCDCDAKLCEFIAETPAQWASVSECEAAMKTRITQNSTLNYPLISGFCRTVTDTAPQMVNAVPTIDPATTDVSSAADAGFIDEVRDGTRMVFLRTANGYSFVRTGLGRIAERALGVVQSAGRLLPERFAGL